VFGWRLYGKGQAPLACPPKPLHHLRQRLLVLLDLFADRREIGAMAASALPETVRRAS